MAGRLRVVELAQRQPGLGCGLAADQSDCQSRRRGRLELDVLEDRHALLPGDDVLQAHDARVLAGDRDVAREPVGLQDADDRVGDVVVGGENAVNLAAGCCQRLSERRRGVGDGPALDDRL